MILYFADLDKMDLDSPLKIGVDPIKSYDNCHLEFL